VNRERSPLSVAAWGLLFALVSAPALAQPVAEEGTGGSESFRRAILWGELWLVRGVTESEQLSLEECLRIAIVHNLSIQNRREDLLSSHEDLRTFRNFFDVKGQLSLQHDQDVRTPVIEQGSMVVFDPVLQENVTTAAESDVIDDDVTTLGLNLSKQLGTGGTISVQPSLWESDFQQNQWGTALILSVNQPLLDGFGHTVATADLESARLALEQSENSLDGAMRSLVAEVASGYYNLLRSELLLDETEQALKRSRDLLRAAKIRREEGEVAQLDVLQAELLVARNENTLISGRNQLRSSQVDFRVLLGLAPDSSAGIASTKVSLVTSELDLDALLSYALDHRLDLINQELSLEQSRLSLLKARNQRLPDLDLYASYSFVDGNDDLEEVWDVDQGSIAVGAVFRLPLGDVSDDVNYQKALISRQKTETSLEEARRQVTSDVDKAVRNIRTLQSQLEVLKKNVEIAEETFRLSQLSYEVGGLISSFDLSSAQDDLTSARTDYVSALIDYKVALIQLDLARGLDLVSMIETQAGSPLR